METKEKVTIIYHADADGRMGGAIAKKWYSESWQKDKDIKYIETNHGKPIEFKDSYETLIIIDFSFKKDIMDKLNKITKEFIWIDHHITAKQENFELWKTADGLRNIDNSGAALTWRYFFKAFPVPQSVKLVEDYDLWNFEYGNDTRYFAEINGVWNMDDFYTLLKHPENLDSQIGHGYTLYTRKELNIKNRIKKENNNIKTIFFEGSKTALINNSQTQDGSLLGNEICKNDYEIALKYTIKKDQMIFGLNSIGDINVGNIARKYKGGGHKNAAGFHLCLEEGFKLLLKLYKCEIE